MENISSGQQLATLVPRKNIVPGSVSSRWTPKIVQNGWTAIAVSFLDLYSLLGITSGEAMFLVHLMRYKWDGGMPFPGFPTIAEKMNLTDTSVRKYARDLEKRQLIRRVQRAGRTTVFDLTPLFRALEGLIETAESANRIDIDTNPFGEIGGKL